MIDKRILLIFGILFLLAAPQLASAAYYRAGTDNAWPTIYTTFVAVGAPDGGDIDCYGYANWGTYRAKAAIYREVVTTQQKQIKVGITWTLDGRIAKSFQNDVQWRAFYFWSSLSDLWGYNNGQPTHSYQVAHDHFTGWFDDSKETHAAYTYTTYFIVPDKVPGSGAVFVGFMIEFAMYCGWPGYTIIEGMETGTPLHIDVTYISWSYV